MALIRIREFKGMWPLRDPQGLPDNGAVRAVNARVDGGVYLNGIRRPRVLWELYSSTMSVFRIPISDTLEGSFWMQFSDINTDVLRAPIVNDSFKRYYWASPSTGLKFASEAQILSGFAGFTSGVKVPETAMTVTPVAGTGEIDPATGTNVLAKSVRSYVVSFINEFGEEGLPGPTAEGYGAADQDWLLTNIPQPGSPGTGAAYTKIVLYRTVVGGDGVAAFYKVTDFPVGTTFYTDRVPDSAILGLGVLMSDRYQAAPAGLQGLVEMPNGMFVSWIDNSIYVCENYRPHAWPDDNKIALAHPIVGLGVFGNTCVVLTKGPPYALSGVKSNALSLTKTDTLLPCVNRRSIVSAPEGVYYASPDGLVLFGPDGPKLITKEFASRENWQNVYLINPNDFKAAYVNGVYTVLRNHDAGDDGFTFNPANVSQEGSFIIDVDEHIPYNIGVDPRSGRPWYIADVGDGVKRLYEWDSIASGTYGVSWTSKEFKMQRPVNMSWAQVFFDDTLSNSPLLQIIAVFRGTNGGVSRELVYNGNVPTPSGIPFRLPSGYLADVWQITVATPGEVQEVLLATTLAELQNA